MKPEINKTSFGSITIDNNKIDHDVVIMLDGKVGRRRKKLSKEVYGTSHTISLKEAAYIYEKGTEVVVIGSGQYGRLKLSNEAESFFESKNVKVIVIPTKEAIEIWNLEKERMAVGLFHITC
jgi:hypothetical protein